MSVRASSEATALASGEAPSPAFIVSVFCSFPQTKMVDEPTHDQRPESAMRPRDEFWLAGLPRAKENVKHDWKAIHCLVTQRRADGIAPIVLETSDRQCLRQPAKCEGAFELCLRHLHGRCTPLQGECTVGALLSNRAAHALKLPGRWVPLPDGAVEDRAAQSAPLEAGTPPPATTSGEKEGGATPSSGEGSPRPGGCTRSSLALEEEEHRAMALASIPSPRKDLSQGRCGDFMEE